MKQTKVTLREKPIKGGTMLSLYLDYYPPITDPKTGKPTRREFPGIHIWAKPRTTEQRQENANKRAVAESIRAKRQVEAATGGADFKVKRTDPDFLAFFLEEAEKKNTENRRRYIRVHKRLVEYCNGAASFPFSRIDREFCEGFRDYLANRTKEHGRTVSPNSTNTYLKVFKAVLRTAYRKELLGRDFATVVEHFKPRKTEREFLTTDEVQRLIETPCEKEGLKRAALFSIFTGLRLSDVRKLTWGEVQQDGGKYFLQYIQKKTGSPEILPLPSVAVSLLGARAADDVKPFKTMPARLDTYLNEWMAAAGITKHITFHCFRHTAATQLIERGVDIYTVQKILGHANVTTTQIYARMLDSKKREAMEKMNFDLTDYK